MTDTQKTNKPLRVYIDIIVHLNQAIEYLSPTHRTLVLKTLKKTISILETQPLDN